jgi:hypothetical protein
MSRGFQQVYPQAVEARLAREVESAVFGEFRRMTRQQLRQFGERGIALGQIIERGIAGVAGVAVLAAPTASGSIFGS